MCWPCSREHLNFLLGVAETNAANLFLAFRVALSPHCNSLGMFLRVLDFGYNDIFLDLQPVGHYHWRPRRYGLKVLRIRRKTASHESHLLSILGANQSGQKSNFRIGITRLSHREFVVSGGEKQTGAEKRVREQHKSRQ